MEQKSIQATSVAQHKNPLLFVLGLVLAAFIGFCYSYSTTLAWFMISCIAFIAGYMAGGKSHKIAWMPFLRIIVPFGIFLILMRGVLYVFFKK